MIISLKKINTLFNSVLLLGIMSFVNNYAYAAPPPWSARHTPVHYQSHFPGPGHYYERRGPSRHPVMHHGYGHYYNNDAYPWIAFTAITLKVLDNVNEDQKRAHESAQVKATTAPVGEQINWNSGGATGSVTTVRDGTSTSGRYCREFQHQVTIAGKSQQAYGIACRQADGSWEVITAN